MILRPQRTGLLTLSLLVLVTLALSAAWTTPALADEAPPSEAPPEGSTTTEVAPAEDTQRAPAAEERASELPIAADPQWCPSGVVPGSATCSFAHADLNDLALDLANGATGPTTFLPSGSGVIWIEGGLNGPDGAFNLDGSSLNVFPMAGSSLTLKGGWTGVGTTININNPAVILGDSFSVHNWTGALTLSDIILIGVVTNPNGTVAPGGNEPALYLQTSGSITLTRVESNGNQGGGNEMTGAFIHHLGAGTVSVTSSRFIDSDNDGLVIHSFGTVILKNVAALGNDDGNGVLVDNTFAATAKPVTVTNGNFSQNLNIGAGLRIESHGAVTLTSINATQNGIEGVRIDNCAFFVVCLGAGPVRVAGANNFSDNGLDGLYVFSNGAISVNQTVASGNGFQGMEIQNHQSSVPQNVTLTGFVTAAGNGREGIVVASVGAVTLANVTAGDNGREGLFISNSVGAPLPKPVTLTGTNVFVDNGRDGLEVLSAGAVTLNNIRAVGNGALGGDANGSGVSIDNAVLTSSQPNVTILGAAVFSDNYATGLSIVTYGAVSLRDVTATNNGNGLPDDSGPGVGIDNRFGDVLKPVLIGGTNQFNSNDGTGLVVDSYGAATLNNLNAFDNGGHGVFVGNANPGNVLLGITISGRSNASRNGVDGMRLQSDGVIRVSNLTLGWNEADGARLDNNDPAPGASPGIFVLGYVNSLANADRGLLILSDGPVSLAYVNASENTGRGVQIANQGAPAPKPVTLTGANVFQDNGDEGLYIDASGAVTLSNLTALRNGSTADFQSGVFIQNCSLVSGSCTLPDVQQNVTLNGINVFNGNAYNGLDIYTLGAVTLSSVTASDNGHFGGGNFGNGVSIRNDTGTLAKAVLVQGINSFIDNDGNGLLIVSDGAITVGKITATYNGNDGANLDNDTGTNPLQSKATISGYGVFDFNGNRGLFLDSNGAVLTTNLTANQNGDNGVEIDTRGLTSPQSVTMNGTNSFFSNGTGSLGSGLDVEADGNIKVNNLSAIANADNGAILDNFSNWFLTAFPTFGSVTVTGFGFLTDNTDGDGLVVLSHGSVSLTGIRSESNGSGVGDSGIEIHADGNVTLVCAVVVGNFDDGLFIGEITPDAAPETVTLKGLVNALNGDSTEDIAGVFTVVRSVCP